MDNRILLPARKTGNGISVCLNNESIKNSFKTTELSYHLTNEDNSGTKVTTISHTQADWL